MANYSISGGVTISAAVLQSDGYTVDVDHLRPGDLQPYVDHHQRQDPGPGGPADLDGQFHLYVGRHLHRTPFSVAVNAKSTNDTSPALTGTITDPAAAVIVRVNGSYYAATNNGDGTWSLPRGDISPPWPAALYNVVATGVNSSGIVAFDPTVNELAVDTTAPTVTIPSPTGTQSLLPSLSIVFSEPVQNFSLGNLQLTLTAAGATASQPLEGATLTTSDNQTWTLGNLSGVDGAATGTYELMLLGQGSKITDLYGNPLSVAGVPLATPSAAASWSGNPNVTSIAPIGSSVTKATSVQYAVTFNENMTGVALGDFTLLKTGTAAGTIASLSGSGSSYTVTINNVAGDGTLGLNLADNDSIKDSQGTPLGGVGAGNGNFAGQLVAIDNTAPTISIGAPRCPWRRAGPSPTR